MKKKLQFPKLPILPNWYQGPWSLGALAVAVIAIAYLTLYVIGGPPPIPNVTPQATPRATSSAPSKCEQEVTWLRGEVAWRDQLIAELKRQVALDKKRWAAEQRSLKE